VRDLRADLAPPSGGALPLRTTPLAAPRTVVAVVALGCGLLTARPVLVGLGGAGPGPVLITLFSALLAVSLLWPATNGSDGAQRPIPVLPVLLVGVGAFVLGRLVAGSPAPVAPAATPFVLAINSLAAVAEEAFFRRLVYGALLRSGPAAALVGSSVLFAAVHVTVYGAWVLPLDLAAGLLLGWQRRATGSWAVPAVAHVVANLLVVL
jgi:membrane protease YdiL (CAAX protease family)